MNLRLLTDVLDRITIDIDTGELTLLKGSQGSQGLGGGGGGSTPGAARVLKFPFAFNTPGLLTGHTIYTPTVGDVLLNAWFEVLTEWDGTTPQADIGTFVGSSGNGLFNFWLPQAVLLNAGAASVQEGTGVQGWGPPSLLELAATSMAKSLYETAAISAVPAGAALFALRAGGTTSNMTSALARFTTTDPVKVCVSQEGFAGGADPGSTQGSGVVYLLIATPA